MNYPHPQSILQPGWTGTFRKYAPLAEQRGQLHPEQLQLIYDQQWFKALVAEEYGGLEWTLPQIVSFEEAIGWADGSAGWVFTLCSGAGWFSGFLDKTFAKQIFKAKRACLAGSGAPSGIARQMANSNYEISGQWAHASGAPHATVFTANCFVEGAHKVKAFCFLKEEVSIIKTWNSIGLTASASESFSVENIILPKERCFEIDVTKAVVKSPLYQYPFLQLAESTIAANLSGMALHYLEECEYYFRKKRTSGTAILWESKKLQGILRQQKEAWKGARDRMHHAVKISWQQLLKTNKIAEEELSAVSHASQQLAKACRQLVNTLYPYTGLTGANRDSPLNRIWRDFQTGSQHAVFMDL